jgi:hypothetical protein
LRRLAKQIVVSHTSLFRRDKQGDWMLVRSRSRSRSRSIKIGAMESLVVGFSRVPSSPTHGLAFRKLTSHRPPKSQILYAPNSDDAGAAHDLRPVQFSRTLVKTGFESIDPSLSPSVELSQAFGLGESP